MTSSDYFATIFQSELVGDVAVPLSVRQAVLFWALRSPDARPRLNWRRSSSTVLSQVCLGRPGRRLQFLGAGDICRLVKHGNDLETCRPGPCGQTTSGVWSAQYLIAVAGQYTDGLQNSLHTPLHSVNCKFWRNVLYSAPAAFFCDSVTIILAFVIIIIIIIPR